MRREGPYFIGFTLAVAFRISSGVEGRKERELRALVAQVGEEVLGLG